MTKTIIDAGDAKYLRRIEGFNDLPSGCLFNKVLTGCGGTSVALWNDKPYVIAMPYTELIISKMDWCREHNVEAVPVFHSSGTTTQDIKDAKKIMVTYDSLQRVADILSEKIHRYKILVDESHLLTKSGAFRYDAVNSVLRLFRDFGDYVFMTATPVKRKYLPDAIKDLPEVTVHWKDITPVSLEYTIFYREELYAAVAGIALRHLKRDKYGNAYFFINSVRSIEKIIKHLKPCGATHSDIRVICSPKTANSFYLKKLLGEDFTIGSVTDSAKKLNFLTSRAFEGADIFDPMGKSYIVSDGLKNHTKYDILITMPQIIGRIRNSIYKDQAHVIFSPSPYFSYTSEAEFSSYVENKLLEAKGYVDAYKNTDNHKAKAKLLEGIESDPYLVLNYSGEPEVNETAWKAEMSNYAAIHATYYIKRTPEGNIMQRENTRTRKINNVPYNFHSVPKDSLKLTMREKLEMGDINFKFREMCETYERISSILPEDSEPQLYGFHTEKDERLKQLIEERYPLIPKAFRTLGYQRIQELNFIQKAIRADMLKLSEHNLISKVRELLDPDIYVVGRRFTKSQIKTDFQDLYDSIGIHKKAKGTDIIDHFEVRETKIRLDDGTRGNGYVIIAPK